LAVLVCFHLKAIMARMALDEAASTKRGADHRQAA
jgi:hypothetical protein